MKEKKLFKGFRVRSFSAILMIVCCLLTISIFVTSLNMRAKHNNLVKIMNDYSTCSGAVTELKKASDKLTYHAVCFLQNNDSDSLQRYFYELNTLNRRAKAVDIVELTHQDDVVHLNTTMAYRESDVLVSIETYAMKLICDAKNMPEDDLPAQLKSLQLSDKDKELSKNEKIAYAKNMLFTDMHLHSRDLVEEYTENATEILLNNFNKEEAECNNYIKRFSNIEFLLIIILIVLCIALYVILVSSVFVPLHHHLIAIQKNDKMKVQGAYEVRYIATAYNALTDKNAMDASVLKHKAEHDPLTGLINREAFDHIISVLSSSEEPVAYLIVDIDLFKNVNDKYGHTVGDKVLVKIARLLNEQFRATDYVGRIGGDEFAIIMTKFGTASVIDIIRRKIASLNKELQAAYDDLPPVTLSVGVAVSDMGFKTSLIENADKALYRVKRGGRCNCCFYGEE